MKAKTIRLSHLRDKVREDKIFVQQLNVQFSKISIAPYRYEMDKYSRRPAWLIEDLIEYFGKKKKHFNSNKEVINRILTLLKEFENVRD